jgi:hypothetical protein
MRKDPESTDNVLRSIRHLRPERLSDSDLMDWSGVRSASVKFEGSPDVHELQWQPRTTKAAPQDFPAGTFGFLYVHVHPVHAALSQLRFRIAAGADKFADGHDLMLPSGIPWHVAVPGLLANRTGAYVKDILVKDGLVSEENCDHWAVRLGVNAHARLIVPGDSFEIGLDIRDITAHLVHGREWCTMRMEMPIKLRRILKSDPACMYPCLHSGLTASLNACVSAVYASARVHRRIGGCAGICTPYFGRVRAGSAH